MPDQPEHQVGKIRNWYLQYRLTSAGRSIQGSPAWFSQWLSHPFWNHYVKPIRLYRSGAIRPGVIPIVYFASTWCPFRINCCGMTSPLLTTRCIDKRWENDLWSSSGISNFKGHFWRIGKRKIIVVTKRLNFS